MKTTERMHMVAVMTEGLESSVDTYCKVKEKKGYSPSAGYVVSREDTRNGLIGNRLPVDL